ncbi:MAG: zinc-dependent metalloprotease, partial [Chloroflexota bacterium]
LVEGFSNHVMDVLGPEMLPDYAHISHAFEGRDRKRGSAEKLFVRLTGLELKMEQYKAGERFVDAVVAAHGIAAMNRAWEGPANLPHLREIYHPQLWLDRVLSSGT